MNVKYLNFNQEVEKHLPGGTDRARILAACSVSGALRMARKFIQGKSTRS